MIERSVDLRYVRYLLLIAGIVVGVLVAGTPAYAHGPTGNDPLAQIDFTPKLNESIPLDVTFRDDAGTQVQLAEFFGQKPVILLFAYYECPNICDMALQGVAESLRKLEWDLGDEFEVVTVGIDSGETAQIATAKKERFVSMYGRSGAEAGWHFLTGEHAEIDRVADAAGFEYAYDAKQDQYAHATGILILTPDGTISRYLAGIQFSPRDVRLGLVEASQNKIGTPVDQVLLRCYHYDPTTGKYSLVIMNVLRLAGGATVLLLGGFMVIMIGRDQITVQPESSASSAKDRG